MGPCTTAWFHSDWSSKVGPYTPSAKSPSLVPHIHHTLSEPLQLG